MTEKVYVLPSKLLPSEEGFFLPDDMKSLLDTIEKEGIFVQREQAEKDPDYKQIIPYSVICYQNYIFTVTRLATQSEERLHNKSSIGIGGHINPIDDKEDELILDAARIREIDEEMFINYTVADVVGCVNDNSNEVGRVHFGIVYRIQTIHPALSVAEPTKMVGRLVSIDELVDSRDELEGWSQMIIDNRSLLYQVGGSNG